MGDINGGDSALALVEAVRRKAPEYLDLLTATTDTEFEKALDVLLEKSILAMEGNAVNFQKLGEEGLTGALALALSIPGLSVTQETNSNGHVDMTIVADHCSPARKRLAEAKLWSGVQHHFKGLEQLLNRYSTGREGRGLLIVFVRKRNIAGRFKKLRARMDRLRPLGQTSDTVPHTFKWAFLSSHAHHSGEFLLVGHMGCNLHHLPRGKGPI